MLEIEIFPWCSFYVQADSIFLGKIELKLKISISASSVSIVWCGGEISAEKLVSYLMCKNRKCLRTILPHTFVSDFDKSLGKCSHLGKWKPLGKLTSEVNRCSSPFVFWSNMSNGSHISRPRDIIHTPEWGFSFMIGGPHCEECESAAAEPTVFVGGRPKQVVGFCGLSRIFM